MAGRAARATPCRSSTSAGSVPRGERRLGGQHPVGGALVPRRREGRRPSRRPARPARCRRSVTVTITPSVASVVQHRGELLESRLPMPHTTHIEPTFEIGCTTWAWWPTTRSTAPASAASASATCLLRGDHLVDVLVAPVQRHDDELGTRRPGRSGVGEDQRRVDLVDEPLLAGRAHEPVEAVGVGEVGDDDAVGLVERRHAALGRAGGAGVGQPGGVERRRAWPPRPARRSRARGSTRPSSRRSRPRPDRWPARPARGTAGSSTGRPRGGRGSPRGGRSPGRRR